MELQRIKALIDAMAASDLAEMEFTENNWSLRLVRKAAVPESAAPVAMRAARSSAGVKPALQPPKPPASAPGEVRAPMFGVVYLRPEPDAPAFVAEGQVITAGMVVCVVEAMKVFNEVRAPRDGILKQVLIAGGQEVEAGQPLMQLADV